MQYFKKSKSSRLDAAHLARDVAYDARRADRTPPGLPLKKGRAATMIHGYKRNGTALDVATGKVIGIPGVPQEDRPRVAHLLCIS